MIALNSELFFIFGFHFIIPFVWDLIVIPKLCRLADYPNINFYLINVILIGTWRESTFNYLIRLIAHSFLFLFIGFGLGFGRWFFLCRLRYALNYFLYCNFFALNSLNSLQFLLTQFFTGFHLIYAINRFRLSDNKPLIYKKRNEISNSAFGNVCILSLIISFFSSHMVHLRIKQKRTWSKKTI